MGKAKKPPPSASQSDAPVCASSSSPAMALQKVQEPEEHVALLPQESYLLLSLPYNSPDTKVVHSLTLETLTLAGRDWRIEVDEEGFACAVNDRLGDDATKLFEDLLKRQVYQTKDKELIVTEPGPDGGLKQWSLTSRMSQYDACSVLVPTGALLVDVRLGAAFLKWYRCGFRFMVSMSDLYKVLRLTSFKGTASKWAFASASRWLSFLSGFASAHVHYWPSRLSTAANSEDLQVWPAMLDWPAVSSFGLIALLSRWAGLSPRCGGLREEGASGRAKELLIGLVVGVTNGRSCVLELRFDTEWEPPWPRSEGQPPAVMLQVTADGSVDLTEWANKKDEVGELVAQRWWDEIAVTLCMPEDNMSIRLVDLLLRTVGIQECKSLFAQVAWQIATSFEVVLYTSQVKGRRSPKCVSAEAMDPLQCLNDRRRLDFELLRCVVACRDATANLRCFSFCTDKANVGGVSLANTILVCPDNRAMVLAPQVEQGSTVGDDFATPPPPRCERP